MFSLGKAHFRLRKLKEAITYFREAIELGWEGPEVRASLAYALTQLGKPLEETRALYESAIQDEEKPWGKSWYALALSAAGEHAAAENYARAAVAEEPYDKYAVLLF